MSSGRCYLARMGLDAITKSDVLAAVRLIRSDGVPHGRGSTKFCLVIEEDHLPPKYVLALAARRSLGRVLSPQEFSGGQQTNGVLEGLGFEVLACSCKGDATRPVRERLPQAPPKPRALVNKPAQVRPARARPAARTITEIVRIASKGRTPDAPSAAQRMLLDAFERSWPSGVSAKFALTPGGFVHARWPAAADLPTGWNSRAKDFGVLTKAAETVLARVVTDRVLKAAASKTHVLTIGIDLMGGPGDVHAELVAVYDVSTGRIVRWTGKSYPTSNQENTLLHVVDLDTHLLEVAGERVLVLGCHDLNMFSPRGRANQSPTGLRRLRCDAMKARVEKFRPTVVLQHPHSTDTPNIWRLPWLTLAKEVPSVRTWASGIAYYRAWGNGVRADIKRVLAQTKSKEGVNDVLLNASSYG